MRRQIIKGNCNLLAAQKRRKKQKGDCGEHHESPRTKHSKQSVNLSWNKGHTSLRPVTHPSHLTSHACAQFLTQSAWCDYTILRPLAPSLVYRAEFFSPLAIIDRLVAPTVDIMIPAICNTNQGVVLFEIIVGPIENPHIGAGASIPRVARKNVNDE